MSEMNWKAVQRRDPSAARILASAQQVAMYAFRGGGWERSEVEGSLHVYARQAQPFHSFLIMNRHSPADVVEPITADMELQPQPPSFLFYKKAGPEQAIQGIWFYDPNDAANITRAIQGIIAEQRAVGPRLPPVQTQSSAAAAASQDIMGLLQRAGPKQPPLPNQPMPAAQPPLPIQPPLPKPTPIYPQGLPGPPQPPLPGLTQQTLPPGPPQPHLPSAANQPPKGLMDLFAAARGHSHPPTNRTGPSAQAPPPPSESSMPPDLQRIFSFPTDGAPLSVPDVSDEAGLSAQFEQVQKAKEAAVSSASPAKATPPRLAATTARLNRIESVGGVSEASMRVNLSQSRLASETPSSELLTPAAIATGRGNGHAASGATPPPPPCLSPTQSAMEAKISWLSLDEEDAAASASAPLSPAPSLSARQNPLTPEQTLQAVDYLIKSEPNFVGTLCTAYMMAVNNK